MEHCTTNSAVLTCLEARQGFTLDPAVTELNLSSMYWGKCLSLTGLTGGVQGDEGCKVLSSSLKGNRTLILLNLSRMSLPLKLADLAR
jgi:hypothetical protein